MSLIKKINEIKYRIAFTYNFLQFIVILLLTFI